MLLRAIHSHSRARRHVLHLVESTVGRSIRYSVSVDMAETSVGEIGKRPTSMEWRAPKQQCLEVLHVWRSYISAIKYSKHKIYSRCNAPRGHAFTFRRSGWLPHGFIILKFLNIIKMDWWACCWHRISEIWELIWETPTSLCCYYFQGHYNYSVLRCSRIVVLVVLVP
jgi:hypothetical protein